MDIIASCDSIALVTLEAELEWKCFIEVPESWERIFKDLKTLHIDFGNTYEDYTEDCVSGLKTVLKWASKLTKLHCGMHWSLCWDDIASEWPDLEFLELDACEVTESFLRSFFDNHSEIKTFNMIGCLRKAKGGDFISITNAAKIFCSSEFNGVRGRISQDEYTTWGYNQLELFSDQIHNIGKDGTRVGPIFRRERS
jgi:hypothetical protein